MFPVSALREHPAGGPTRPVAAGAGMHAAGLPVGGPRRPQCPEGDLPGEGAAAPPGAGGVPPAQRGLEGQVHISKQLWVPGADRAEKQVPRPVFNTSSLMLWSHSEFQIILVQQVRPRHPESRNSHGQKSGRSVGSVVHGTVWPTNPRTTTVGRLSQ